VDGDEIVTGGSGFHSWVSECKVKLSLWLSLTHLRR